MFADHVVYHDSDFDLRVDDVVVITEKDWRKLEGLSLPCQEIWYLKVGVAFDRSVDERLQKIFQEHGIL